MTGCISGAAEAKINLGLRILGRRDDGYHEIRSVFHTVSLADAIEVGLTDSPGIAIEVAGGDGRVPADATNLACRAASAFIERAGLPYGAAIRIRKRIPAGGGLGGGSSDAACTLRLLRELTGMDPGIGSIALSLGSDVPFFLRGGAAVVTGRGDRISPIRTGDFWAVIVDPGIPSSTAGAYADWDLKHAGLTMRLPMYDLPHPELAWHEGRPFPVSLCNDFLPLLAERSPVMAETAARLDVCASTWGLSGSGSCFYALFRTACEAESLGASIPRRYARHVCRATGSAGVSSNW
ncbi:MAG: 4-(cytidine 5'-diphospho)-2-C-methyl-D-erythritol kinase [Candidatus Fermentibacter sp.]|nr:4-(cytidine 5'-diphospho)-2-C-methyl-D-erythritol kinase [Candidatus Fermentibacter sp.]